jgi:hypothetical protein
MKIEKRTSSRTAVPKTKPIPAMVFGGNPGGDRLSLVIVGAGEVELRVVWTAKLFVDAVEDTAESPAKRDIMATSVGCH